MNLQRWYGIFGTSRTKTATRGKTGGNKISVKANQTDTKSDNGSGFKFVRMPARCIAIVNAFFTAGILTFRIPLRGMITKQQGWTFSAPISLSDSRINLLALFLFTALTWNFLLHIIPQRRSSPVSGIHNIVKRPDDSRRPICFTLSNSLRQRRLSNAFTGVVLPAVYRQSARRLRPFARRRFRTKRPPAVFILFLNPQVRRRLILEGW